MKGIVILLSFLLFPCSEPVLNNHINIYNKPQTNHNDSSNKVEHKLLTQTIEIMSRQK